jgi:hypothetical protein
VDTPPVLEGLNVRRGHLITPDENIRRLINTSAESPVVVLRRNKRTKINPEICISNDDAKEVEEETKNTLRYIHMYTLICINL